MNEIPNVVLGEDTTNTMKQELLDSVDVSNPEDVEKEVDNDEGFVVYEKDGLNLLNLKNNCIKAVQEWEGDDMENAPIYLPTFADKKTKYNKIRLIPEEKASPFGIIQRNNEFANKFADQSCGKFKAVEVLVWLFERTGGEI